jgi:hypothetical protein
MLNKFVTFPVNVVPKSLFRPKSSSNFTTLHYRMYTWFGYNVPGMILLHDLEGAILLECSKDMSGYVSNYISQNHKWRLRSSLSSISRVLVAFNSFHKAKQSTRLIMSKYHSDFMKLCVEEGLISFNQFLEQLEHQSCSPDLTLNDPWMFPKIKSPLKGWRFQDTEDVQKEKKWQQWKHHGV